MQTFKESTTETSHTPKASPVMPATENQRALLRLAIKKDLLHPNTFIGGNYKKWEKLSTVDADKLLISLPPNKLDELEKELEASSKHHQELGITRGVGRGIEDSVKKIGHTIDGGIA